MWTKEEILRRDPTGTARGKMWDRLLRDWNNCWQFVYTSRRNAKREWMQQHNYTEGQCTHVAMNNLSEKDFPVIDLTAVYPSEYDAFEEELEDYLEEAEVDYMNSACETLSTINYVSCSPTTAPVYVTTSNSGLNWYKPLQEKETNMGYEYNMEVDQRNHLKRRLDDVRQTKRNTLVEKYAINLEHPAKTKDEVLTALKNGEIEFSSFYYDAEGRLKSDYHADGTFSLKNPKTDRAGYESAEKLLGTAYTAAKDAIIVKPLADGLAALNEFEAKEF